MSDVPRLSARINRDRDEMVLVSRRHVRSNNSWMHNAPALMTGRDRCTLLVHPDDAKRLGIADGRRARVRSQSGELVVPVEVSDEMLTGVVSLPHGWGHRDSGLAYASAHRAGVNVNALAGDGASNTERLSGMAQLTAFPVRVKPVGTPDRSEEQ